MKIPKGAKRKIGRLFRPQTYRSLDLYFSVPKNSHSYYFMLVLTKCI